MNYEDRADLQPPDSLISSPTLRALFAAWPRAKDLLRLAFGTAAEPVDQSLETKLTRVVRPQAELEGAPPEAWPLGLAAAKAGYRLGDLMLGKRNGPRTGDDRTLAEAVHRMDIYDLFDRTSDEIAQTLRERLAGLIRDVGAPQRGDFEEYGGLCFSLGLAAAVVDFDQAADGTT